MITKPYKCNRSVRARYAGVPCAGRSSCALCGTQTIVVRVHAERAEAPAEALQAPLCGPFPRKSYPPAGTPSSLTAPPWACQSAIAISLLATSEGPAGVLSTMAGDSTSSGDSGPSPSCVKRQAGIRRKGLTGLGARANVASVIRGTTSAEIQDSRRRLPARAPMQRTSRRRPRKRARGSPLRQRGL